MNPRLITLSGGRTSGYMLHMLLEQGLGADDHVVFANTGREHEGTLAFLHEIETRWGVNPKWVEYNGHTRFRLVSYERASREGEPFAWMIQRKKFVPNASKRICTINLKIKTCVDYMHSSGYQEWDKLLAIRYDEPIRKANVQEYLSDKETPVLPLFDSRITKANVLEFWKKQPFDLDIPTHCGNCDLCFLKGPGKITRQIALGLADPTWWIEVEQAMGHTFRKKVPVAVLAERARAPKLFSVTETYNEPDALQISCICGID